jgi:hypothetical protein
MPQDMHQEFVNGSVQMNSLDTLETVLDELINRILSACQITHAEQQQFLSVLLARTTLSESEQTQIDRLFDGLHSGLIKIIG